MSLCATVLTLTLSLTISPLSQTTDRVAQEAEPEYFAYIVAGVEGKEHILGTTVPERFPRMETKEELAKFCKATDREILEISDSLVACPKGYVWQGGERQNRSFLRYTSLNGLDQADLHQELFSSGPPSL